MCLPIWEIMIGKVQLPRQNVLALGCCLAVLGPSIPSYLVDDAEKARGCGWWHMPRRRWRVGRCCDHGPLINSKSTVLAKFGIQDHLPFNPRGTLQTRSVCTGEMTPRQYYRKLHAEYHLPLKRQWHFSTYIFFSLNHVARRKGFLG